MINKAPYSWRMPIYAPFTDALTPPSVDPVTETDMVSVCFNKAYLPFILGALAVYTYDDAFNLDNAPEPTAVQRFYTLIGIFVAAIEDCGLMDFDVRQNEDEPCILEKFVDGEWTPFANLRLCPPLVRLNVNFEIEISFDDGETWETVVDNPTPPVPTPVPDQDNLCLASASSVVAFNETYKEVKRLFQDEVSVYTIAAAAISLLGTFIFFPPAFPFVFAFFVELYSLLSEITDDEFDTDTQEEFKCILYANGEIIDGAAHYDYDTVLATVHAKWGLLDVNIWAAIEYLLQVVQADGLDRSGSTGVVTEADCDECVDLFCRISDWTIDEDGYSAGYPGFENPYTSVWVSGEGWKQSGIYNSISNGFHQYVEPITIRSFRLDWNGSHAGCTGCGASLQLWLSGTLVYTGSIPSTFDDGFIFNADIDTLCDLIVVGGDAGAGGSFAFTRLEVVYSATDPVLGEDNCP